MKPSSDIKKGHVRQYSDDIVQVKNSTGIKLHFDVGRIGGRAFEAQDLSSCAVYVSDLTDRMTIMNCSHCTFALATVRNTIQVINCTDCQFTVVCRQFRIRNSSNCDVFLHTKDKSIIEKSRRITFACGTYSYHKIIDQMVAAHLDPYMNMFSKVYDITPGLSEYQVKEGERSSISSGDGSCLLPYFYTASGRCKSLELPSSSWEDLTRVSFKENVKLTALRNNGSIIFASFDENHVPSNDLSIEQS